MMFKDVPVMFGDVWKMFKDVRSCSEMYTSKLSAFLIAILIANERKKAWKKCEKPRFHT